MAPAGSGTGRARKLGEVPAVHGELTHGADSALVHVQRPAVVAQAGVNGTDAPGVADRRAAQERQGPVGRDGVTGDLT